MRRGRRSIAFGDAPSTSTWRTIPSRSMNPTWQTQAFLKVVSMVTCRSISSSPPPSTSRRDPHQAPSYPPAWPQRLTVLHRGELQCRGEDRPAWQALSDNCEPHPSHRHTLTLPPSPQDCDEFTRNFLRKLGVRVLTPLQTPDDPYTFHRHDVSLTPPPHTHSPSLSTLHRFRRRCSLYGRTKSRTPFDSSWTMIDKSFASTASGMTVIGTTSSHPPSSHLTHTLLLHSMFGDLREMELHYFLADDTVEILEKVPPNSGRDAVPVFLRRLATAEANSVLDVTFDP